MRLDRRLLSSCKISDAPGPSHTCSTACDSSAREQLQFFIAAEAFRFHLALACPARVPTLNGTFQIQKRRRNRPWNYRFPPASPLAPPPPPGLSLQSHP